MKNKKTIVAYSLLKYQYQAILIILGLFLAACHSPQPPLEPGEMQAGWGEAIFQMECAQCHNPNRIVPLTVAQITPYRNAENLFLYIRETMPPQKPGTLPDYDYWAVTAYLFAAADAPIPIESVLGPETAAEIGFDFE